MNRVRSATSAVAAVAILAAATASAPARADSMRNGLLGALIGAAIGGAAGGGRGAAAGGLAGLSIGVLSGQMGGGSRGSYNRQDYSEQQYAEEALVASVESELQALGYDTGPVDGIYTAETRHAIESFQYNKELPIDGEATQSLLQELQAARVELYANGPPAGATGQPPVGYPVTGGAGVPGESGNGQYIPPPPPPPPGAAATTAWGQPGGARNPGQGSDDERTAPAAEYCPPPCAGDRRDDRPGYAREQVQVASLGDQAQQVVANLPLQVPESERQPVPVPATGAQTATGDQTATGSAPQDKAAKARELLAALSPTAGDEPAEDGGAGQATEEAEEDPAPEAVATVPVKSLELAAAPARMRVVVAKTMSERQLISAVQRSLTRLDYDPGPVDGVLGPKTVEAVEAFEADQGLEVTGDITETLLRQVQLAVLERLTTAQSD